MALLRISTVSVVLLPIWIEKVVSFEPLAAGAAPNTVNSWVPLNVDFSSTSLTCEVRLATSDCIEVRSVLV